MEEKMIKDLTLLLIYLTGWEENSRKSPGEKVFRSWKEYLFRVLNKLEDEDMICQFPMEKTLTLTDMGIEQASKILDNIYENKKESK